MALWRLTLPQGVKFSFASQVDGTVVINVDSGPDQLSEANWSRHQIAEKYSILITIDDNFGGTQVNSRHIMDTVIRVTSLKLDAVRPICRLNGTQWRLLISGSSLSEAYGAAAQLEGATLIGNPMHATVQEVDRFGRWSTLETKSDKSARVGCALILHYEKGKGAPIVTKGFVEDYILASGTKTRDEIASITEHSETKWEIFYPQLTRKEAEQEAQTLLGPNGIPRYITPGLTVLVQAQVKRREYAHDDKKMSIAGDQ